MGREIPFYSPNPKAKLYKRYEADRDITLELNAGREQEVITIGKQVYRHHADIKWKLVDDITSAVGQPLQGLLVDTQDIIVQTNSLHDIKTGDVLWVQSGVLDNKYSISSVRQQYTYSPKPRATVKYLELTKLV